MVVASFRGFSHPRLLPTLTPPLSSLPLPRRSLPTHPQERREQGSPGAPTGTKGFVSLGSLASLDDVSVDLSDQLRPRNVEASSAPVAPPAKAPPSPARPPEARRPGVYARLPPSKGEARRWDRSRAAAGRPVVAAGPATEEEMTEEQRAKRERNAKR